MREGLNVCIIGSGYVGLVTGACLAELGHRVVCVDSDAEKIRTLKAGKTPIYEQGLQKLLKTNVRRKRLFFTSSIAEGMTHDGKNAQIVFISVGTPPLPDGSADLTAVEKVAEEIAKSLKSYTLIVEKSTVPVETGDWVERTISAYNKKKIPFDVASNPEFLREGSAVHDFLHPDRIVLGVSSTQAERLLKRLYTPLRVPLVITDLKSAEIIKHASNSFLALKISYINAVANLCEKVGADVERIAEGMGLDARIGRAFLNAGAGYGGFCFPKDLDAFYWISRKKGYDFKLLEEVRRINDAQRKLVVRKVEEELWNLQGKTVGLLGLAFKPDTDDLRLAPSLEIIAELREKGVKIQATDPVAMPKARAHLTGVKFCADAYECAAGADALILVTEWQAYKNLNFKKILKLLRHPVIVDARNLYDPGRMRRMGFRYRSIGRP
ncbi:MAG: UDP-glucose/GDP-mannose dehydrogenase family protein [Elusimicrobia bacterium]|nr:UDP-glucose/GDP-mannose dehydrogenase family protein [Elusimicrobiota bacterium]